MAAILSRELMSAVIFAVVLQCQKWWTCSLELQGPLPTCQPWWHHGMERISTLLTLCEGNPLVTYRIPSQRVMILCHEEENPCEPIQHSWDSGAAWLHTEMCSLQWRHNEHNGISNHQLHDCLLNRLFRRRSEETSKLRVTGPCAGNWPETGEFPAQRASYAENVSIWWRHHVNQWLIDS